MHLSTMQSRREFVLLASIAVAFFGTVWSSSVKTYGSVKPPKDVLKRIDDTRKPMGCTAHVLPTLVSRKGASLGVTVNLLRWLPLSILSRNTTFKLDELYVYIPSGGSLTDEIHIEDKKSHNLLARVPLNSSKTGYRAIKMRGVFVNWLADQKGSLQITLPQKHMALTVSNSKIYFVIYAYSITGLFQQTAMPKPLKCEFYKITVKRQSSGNTVKFQTKICSPPDEVTFPFNTSSLFNMGVALRKSLKETPIPKNETVLRNPKCCHATKASSRIFVGPVKGEVLLKVQELTNIEITECGCGGI